MLFLVWVLLITRLVSTTAVLQRKSVAPQPVTDPNGGGTQTINTAPITIHIPLLKSHAAHEPSDAPAAIASEAPEGTYLLPVTEQSKPDSPPAINLVLNLRLLMDGERKPGQSEALTVVTEKAPNPAANSGEYVAHEVKLVAPNTNVNSGLQGLQEGATTTSPSGLSTGAIQGDISGTSSTLVNSPNGPREPKPRQNYGVAPSFLLVPKRRVFHNVRSSLKANVPGIFSPQKITLDKFRQQILSAHNRKRQLHMVPPLAEDQKLNMEAQNFAIILASQGNMTHSSLKDRVGQGENIALRCSVKGPPLTGARATNLWYDESKKFNWKVKSLTPATERFTQMVWKNTSKVGFGRAQFTDKAGRTCFVVVARYEPAGNERGKLMDNVFKPSERT